MSHVSTWDGNRLVPDRTPAVWPDPGPGWDPIYYSTFAVDDGWTHRLETQSNDNSYNMPKNVKFGPRGMVIEGIREAGYPRPYTSGDTLGQHISIPNYFRWDVAASLPTAHGMWPGFWLRPLTRPGGSPGNGAEIDLVETWTMSWPPPKMSATIHPNYDADPRPPHAGANLNYSVLPNSDPAALHIYTCIKTPGRIEFLCDGIRIYAWDSDVPVWNGALRHGPPPAWYNDAYEAAGTTWYPRFTLQIGMGTGGNNAEPDADWAYSEIVIPWTRIYKRSID